MYGSSLDVETFPDRPRARREEKRKDGLPISPPHHAVPETGIVKRAPL